MPPFRGESDRRKGSRPSGENVNNKESLVQVALQSQSTGSGL